MLSLDSTTYPKRSREELADFIRLCRERAREQGERQLAVISLRVRHLVPLAVLESVHEAGNFHCFIESGYGDQATACAEAVLIEEASGEKRFEQLRQASQRWFDASVCIGDAEGEQASPRFYFHASLDPEGSEPTASIYIPRWEVRRGSEGDFAVCNFLVEAEVDVEALTTTIWALYQKFHAYDYAPVRGKPQGDPLVREAPAAGEEYEAGVRAALEAIEQGRFDKVVLSRCLELEREEDWQGFRIMHQLRDRCRGSHVFSLGTAQTWMIGATPEKLFSLQGGDLYCEALAGSMPRGESASEDAQLAASLMHDAKLEREHRYVVEHLAGALRRLGVEELRVGSSRPVRLPDIQHLKTPVRAQTAEHPLALVDALYPTPAICGDPPAAALSWIREYEPATRGLFSGLFGWFDGRYGADIYVALRCAQLNGKRARLHAGAGIVAGSDPAVELHETELKLEAMRQVLHPQVDG